MSKCQKCDRPVNDALCCTECAKQARVDLATIAYLTAHADEKRARIGSTTDLSGGSTSRAAETPLPFDPRVTRVLQPILISLQSTGRSVVEDYRPNLLDPLGYGPELGYTDPRMDWLKADSLPSVANWLVDFTDWLRHQQQAVEEFDIFERAAANVVALFDRSPDRLYMGRCNTETEAGKCPESLYVERNAKGEPDSAAINCPRCKAVHDVAGRRAELRDGVADYQATTREISRLCRYTEDGDVSVRMLQMYAQRGFLQQRGVRLEPDKWGRLRKVATYRIGDVGMAIQKWAQHLDQQRGKKRRAA